ncbi:hypothetical protein [Paenibacillus sp. JCM 10914]|uniref:hypothetical protein n=1 Tax=Paenibacillus sp. JCM 10914 TaxID=1236974 RepID=UPI0003CC9183|nr:hypothetical protein [Paenibacillus sp. JCM 10914]GAE09462.1 hypothetical protein JCM10914_5822 [Paenibacillus sp. JCM 10914]
MSINKGRLRVNNDGGGQADELPFWPVLITLFLGSFVGMYHVVSLNVSLPGFMAYSMLSCARYSGSLPASRLPAA